MIEVRPGGVVSGGIRDDLGVRVAGLDFEDAEDGAVEALGGRQVRDCDGDVVEHAAEATFGATGRWPQRITAASEMEAGGIEPPTERCKRPVFPLAPRPRGDLAS